LSSLSESHFAITNTMYDVFLSRCLIEALLVKSRLRYHLACFLSWIGDTEARVSTSKAKRNGMYQHRSKGIV